MRLLVIEDEKKTADYLHKGLSESGFVVEVSRDGVDGLYRAQSEPFDAVILDIMLPGKDGWEVLSELRQGDFQVPVLMLTARDDVSDRVRGLEGGADDYLAKPFAFSELLARLRTILRRGPVRQPETVKIADLEIDFFRHQVHRASRRIDLTAKEFCLLTTLARHTGEVLTRTWLVEQVWNMYFDPGTNVVDVAVGRLRRKIDGPDQIKLIHTIRGVGYVLEVRQDS
jgi:two-component system copper resistance phosphate regulon response regulator CusR